MRDCPSCGEPIKASETACPSCGGAFDVSATATYDYPEAVSASDDSPSLSMQDLLAPGQLLAGRYRVIEFLGRGGMGQVVRALDQSSPDSGFSR